MNIYDDFFKGMSPEEWEFFAFDFLSFLGYTVVQEPSRGPDGGIDGVVSLGPLRFIVSCKHNIQSGNAVGVHLEQSILDRIVQHRANGFIGVYSTPISTSLSERLLALSKQGYECKYFDKNSISNDIPKMSSYTLQKYGKPKAFKIPLNVSESMYRKLPCLGCGVDILEDKLIPYSLACIQKNHNDELEFLYGCKKCMSNYGNPYWIECSQALHQEQLIGWNECIREEIETSKVSKNFYQNKSEFEDGIRQRMFPSNWGTWLAG